MRTAPREPGRQRRQSPEKTGVKLNACHPRDVVDQILDSARYRNTTPVLDKIKQAARRFLLQMRPKDLAMVVSFDSEIQVLCPLSSDPKELRDAINGFRALKSR